MFHRVRMLGHSGWPKSGAGVATRVGAAGVATRLGGAGLTARSEGEGVTTLPRDHLVGAVGVSSSSVSPTELPRPEERSPFWS